MSGRYVYAQCMAGFNDIVIVLGTLAAAAKEGGRLLVLDTRHPVPEGYGVDLWESFNLSDECPWSKSVVQGASRGVHAILNEAKRTVYPEALGWEGFTRYSRGAQQMRTDYLGWHDKDTNLNMQISDNLLKRIRDPKDPTGVVVTSTWAPRNGISSVKTLPYLSPCLSIRERYKWARLQLPKKGYISVHVRDTDIKANTQQLLKKFEDRLRAVSGAIHLATDNPKTIQAFADAGIRVFCFTTFPDSDAPHFRNLHGDRSLSGTCRLHDAVVDLMLMHSAVNFISNSGGGYSKLGRSLFTKKTRFGTRASRPVVSDCTTQDDESFESDIDKLVHAHM